MAASGKYLGLVLNDRVHMTLHHPLLALFILWEQTDYEAIEKWCGDTRKSSFQDQLW